MSHTPIARLAAVAALACAATAVPAFAEQQVAPSKAVSYSDLDLASEAGAHQLQKRIRAAADDVCNVRADRMTAREHVANRCRSRVVAKMKPRVEAVVAAARTETRYASADSRHSNTVR